MQYTRWRQPAIEQWTDVRPSDIRPLAAMAKRASPQPFQPITGTPLRTIVERYGPDGPSKTALLCHRVHVAGTLNRQTQARESKRTGTLLGDIRAGEGRAERLYGQAEEILASALKDKDRRTALQAIRAAVDVMGQARGYLELRGELTGELDRRRVSTCLRHLEA